MHGLFDQRGHIKRTVQELCNVEKNGVRRPDNRNSASFVKFMP